MRPPIHPGLARLRKMKAVELAGRIASARAMDLAALSPEQIETRIRPLLDGYLTKLINIRTNGVFRARIVPPGVNLFENAAELWYPPASLITRTGRFNRAGEVKFYCSNRVKGALLEMRVKPGDRLALVVAGSRAAAIDIRCTHVGLHRCQEEPEIMTFAQNGLRGLLPFLQELRELGVERKWLRIDDYLTELAVAEPEPDAEQNHYKVTNVISDVLGRIPAQQALLYPSVATSLRSFNMALTPAHADNFFFPAECWQFEIDCHVSELPGAPVAKGGYFGFRVVARSTAIDEGGAIAWRSAVADEFFELQLAIQRAGQIRSERYASG